MKNWELILTEEDFYKRIRGLAQPVLGTIATKFPVAICPRLSTDPNHRVDISYDFKNTLYPSDLTKLEKFLKKPKTNKEIFASVVETIKNMTDEEYAELLGEVTEHRKKRFSIVMENYNSFWEVKDSHEEFGWIRCEHETEAGAIMEIFNERYDNA